MARTSQSVDKSMKGNGVETPFLPGCLFDVAGCTLIYFVCSERVCGQADEKQRRHETLVS